MPPLPKKGSVLVFSLIILSIILSAAITVATVSVTNERSASSTGKSVQSFQVADSGIELALQKIYKDNYATLNALATGMGGGAFCTGGSISRNDVVGGSIKVSFYDNDSNLVTCTDTAWRDKVVRIKSEGAAFGTTRVVETAVAAGGITCVQATRHQNDPIRVYYESGSTAIGNTAEVASVGVGSISNTAPFWGMECLGSYKKTGCNLYNDNAAPPNGLTLDFDFRLDPSRLQACLTDNEEFNYDGVVGIICCK